MLSRQIGAAHPVSSAGGHCEGKQSAIVGVPVVLVVSVVFELVVEGSAPPAPVVLGPWKSIGQPGRMSAKKARRARLRVLCRNEDVRCMV